MYDRHGYALGMLIALVTCVGFFYAGAKYQAVVVPYLIEMQEN